MSAFITDDKVASKHGLSRVTRDITVEAGPVAIGAVDTRVRRWVQLGAFHICNVSFLL